MHDQDDILDALSRTDEMSTFDFRTILGIYPRRLLNTILLDAGLVEKFMKDRRVMWKITDSGRGILDDSDKVDTFANLTVLEISEQIAEDVEEIETIPEKEKKGWFRKKFGKK